MARAKNDVGNGTGGSTRTPVADGTFSSEDIILALKVQNTYGVPASVTLGQYALESGYGKSTVGKNNYFNIKGNGNGGYRDYDSKEQSFMDFGALLSGKRYTSKTSSATNVKEYVQGVKDAGYAEDPNYVSKVMKIINNNNLKMYDDDDLTGLTGGGGVTSTGSYIDGAVTYGTGKLGLEWWGDVVRVVLVLLIVGGGLVFLAMSAGQLGANVPSVPDVLKGSKGGK